ncbi:hypothetical protein P0W64_01995 [Tsukamurella sp. 8F]|uniref:hypothetical protein n=1 Tax=unclassified Tsukamurella TaxID=2633480 RepID=UPI0023B8915B|nr:MULTISPECIES: hypothetical protein [unclassified Tsukamurella]MDF0528582.1 hypothetical protein [Tsukamurella sp. 8J]MDF0585544.1 hypothetical protein [Tsukamurella sp. 8F]
MAGVHRLAVLGWLSDDEQNLVAGVDADPAEFERGELRSEVWTETVFELMSLGSARDSGALFCCAPITKTA